MWSENKFSLFKPIFHIIIKYFKGIHEEMLNDKVRTLSYKNAMLYVRKFNFSTVFLINIEKKM